MSDHFLVVGKMVVAENWGRKPGSCRREVVRVEELCKPDKELVYQERVQELYDEVNERELGEVEDEWGAFKEIVSRATAVCGKRIVGRGIR